MLPRCSGNRAYFFITVFFRAIAHPKARQVGAYGLRRPRALTAMFSLFFGVGTPPSTSADGADGETHARIVGWSRLADPRALRAVSFSERPVRAQKMKPAM